MPIELKYLVQSLSFFMLILSFSSQSFADSTRTIKLSSDGVSVEIPGTWKQADGLFGLEAVFLSPISGNSRIVLTITDLELKKNKLDIASIGAHENEYRENKLRWLRKRKGTIEGFDSLKILKVSDKYLRIAMGVRYELSGNHFSERSFIIQCSTGIYHIKFLYLYEISEKYIQEAENVVRSFACLT